MSPSAAALSAGSGRCRGHGARTTRTSASRSRSRRGKSSCGTALRRIATDNTRRRATRRTHRSTRAGSKHRWVRRAAALPARGPPRRCCATRTPRCRRYACPRRWRCSKAVTRRPTRRPRVRAATRRRRPAHSTRSTRASTRCGLPIARYHSHGEIASALRSASSSLCAIAKRKSGSGPKPLVRAGRRPQQPQ